MDPGFTTLSRHEEYYINGGDLYFLVERVSFRVHSYFFQRESPRFKGQLSIPASPGAQRQGTSDSNAIVIEGVKAAHFAKFLWVFYNPKYSLYKTCVADWVTILELAQKWQFHEVKDLCVRELEKLQMPDVDRVAAYNNFDVDKNLLVPRYAALCERETPLSLQEGILLGMEVAIRIASAREHARANPASPSGARSPHPAHLADSEMTSLVREMFDIPAPTDDGANDTPPNPVGATTNAQTKAQQSKPAPPTPAAATNNNKPANNTQTQPAKPATPAPAANGNANPPITTLTTNGSAAANGDAAKADKDNKDAAKDAKKDAKDTKPAENKSSGAAPEASTKVEAKANTPLKVAVSGANKAESESSRPPTPGGNKKAPWTKSGRT